jgi:aspartate racemase
MTTTPMTIIGVIGGVGPQAGLDFVQKIFSNTNAKTDQEHLNCILISCSSIIPDRTGFLLHNQDGQAEDASKENNPAFGLFESARRLHMAGVRFAAIACNTAHASRIFTPFCSMVKESLPDFQIINMLETCSRYVKESLKINRLGLLATKGTHKSKVYHEYFKKDEGFFLIEPDDAEQEKIHDAIYNKDYGIKADVKKISAMAIDCINKEIFSLIERGAEAIILGCTELPLAIQSNSFPVQIIDPGLICARRLIELAAPEKLLA